MRSRKWIQKIWVVIAIVMIGGMLLFTIWPLFV